MPRSTASCTRSAENCNHYAEGHLYEQRSTERTPVLRHASDCKCQGCSHSVESQYKTRNHLYVQRSAERTPVLRHMSDCKCQGRNQCAESYNQLTERTPVLRHMSYCKCQGRNQRSESCNQLAERHFHRSTERTPVLRHMSDCMPGCNTCAESCTNLLKDICIDGLWSEDCQQ
jgi:hypothetical protein